MVSGDELSDITVVSMLRAKIPDVGNTPVNVQLAAGTAGEARSLRTSDVEGVARLFQKTFRDPRKAAPTSLAAYIEAVFLNHPWQDNDRVSKIIVDADGVVIGFVGVLPQRLQYGDSVIRTSVLGSLMSHEPQRNPLVGARLLRAALHSQQDVAMSESANPLSLKMWEKSGGVTLPLHSLNWARILRPASLPMALLGERVSLARKATALTAPLDWLAQRLAPQILAIEAPDGPAGEDVEVGADEFASTIPALCARYSIRPVWDASILGWMLEHAATKARYGTMNMRLVRGRGGRIVGGYIYYGKAGGIAFALQLFAEPKFERLVVGNLLSHIAARGFSAVRGRVQPEFLDALVRQHSLLFRRSAAVMHTRNDELRTALLDGSALITGLAAEAWTRLIGDDFSD
jgi:hypothetical protein